MERNKFQPRKNLFTPGQCSCSCKCVTVQGAGKGGGEGGWGWGAVEGAPDETQKQ